MSNTKRSPVLCFNLKRNVTNVSKQLRFGNVQKNEKYNRTKNRTNLADFHTHNSVGAGFGTKTKVLKDLGVNSVGSAPHNEDIYKISNGSSLCSATNKAKRKLDFDEDDNCYKKKKVCPSLPIETVEISPNTRKFMFRSVVSERPASSSSSRSVRRNLFGTFCKNINPTQSPILTNNSKSNVMNLSLNKKLPNVTSNTSSRTNLLLNLAISKYNISGSENKYNSNSNCKNSSNKFSDGKNCFPVSSPVLREKRIKRKLNFEDKESKNDLNNSARSSVFNSCNNTVDSNKRKSQISITTENKSDLSRKSDIVANVSPEIKLHSTFKYKIRRKLNGNKNCNLGVERFNNNSVTTSDMALSNNTSVSPELLSASTLKNRKVCQSRDKDTFKRDSNIIENQNKMQVLYSESEDILTSPILNCNRMNVNKTKFPDNFSYNNCSEVDLPESKITLSSHIPGLNPSDVSKLVQNSQLRSSMRSKIQNLTEINSSDRLIEKRADLLPSETGGHITNISPEIAKVGNSSPILKKSDCSVVCCNKELDDSKHDECEYKNLIIENRAPHSCNITENRSSSDSLIFSNRKHNLKSMSGLKNGTCRDTKIFTNIFRGLAANEISNRITGRSSDTILSSTPLSKSIKNCQNHVLRKNDSVIAHSEDDLQRIEGTQTKYIKDHMQRFLDDCISITQENVIELNGDDINRETVKQSRDITCQETLNENLKNNDSNAIPMYINNIQIIDTDDFNIQKVEEESSVLKNKIYVKNPKVLENMKLFQRGRCEKKYEESYVIEDNTDTENDDSKSGHELEEINKVEDIFRNHLITANEDQTLSTPSKIHSEQPLTIGTFDSNTKVRRKKINPDSLVSRMKTVVNRMKSSTRMWQYELSKNLTIKIEAGLNDTPGIFRITKLWKENFHLILQCHSPYEDNSDYNYDEIVGNTLLMESIPNYLFAILNEEHSSLSLKCSHLVRIHPPWQLLYLNSCRVNVLLNIQRIQVVSDVQSISEDKEIHAEDNLVRGINSEAIGECECVFPKEICTIMETLLDFNYSSSIKNEEQNLKSYTVEMLSKLKNTIYEAVSWKPLCPINCIQINLKISSIHKIDVKLQKNAWFIVGCDISNELCCLIIKDIEKWSDTLRLVKLGSTYNFSGIIPWKRISWKNNREVIDWLSSIGCVDSSIMDFDSYQRNYIYSFLISETCGFIVRSFL